MEIIKYNHGEVVQKSGPETTRLSSLKEATMMLEGHCSEIFCGKFSSTGDYLATAGFERIINLWYVHGNCEIFSTLRGHKGPIVDLKITKDGTYLYSASTDKTIGHWDASKARLIRKYRGHSNIVNTCDISIGTPVVMCSGSDDGTIKIWDHRTKDAEKTFDNKYQVLSIALNLTANKIYSSGIDNIISVWDVRSDLKSTCYSGHSDTVCGMEISPDGGKLLTSSYDNTVRIWNIQPYFNANRNIQTLKGVSNNFEHNLYHVAWSPCGNFVGSGSGDGFAYIWRQNTGQLIYRLPGHRGPVNEIDFHPSESIVATISTDRMVLMGELSL